MDARSLIPENPDLDALAAAAKGCQACELYEDASQTVFGTGNRTAKVVLVGEQPGDVEDQRGLPFVGPAGKLLQKAVAEAGFEQGAVYVTNAVKHFRFELRGRRRIHQNPQTTHIKSCAPWIETELALVRPEVVVCLGGTAMKALLGNAYRVTRDRGALLPFPALPGTKALITLHPSAVLRMPPDAHEEGYAGLVADLRTALAAVRTG